MSLTLTPNVYPCLRHPVENKESGVVRVVVLEGRPSKETTDLGRDGVYEPSGSTVPKLQGPSYL